MTDATRKDRRRFLATGAMALASARLTMFDAEANQRVPRELAAIGNAAGWLNSPRLTADRLIGKVVLVNFCTYTCINWLRQLPYVRAWAHKYAQDLVVVGVHTPEFTFEHNLENVRRELQRLRVQYPIVMDNDYAIWRAFNNQYWPALYLFDPRGRVRHRHFGEGAYDDSERNIQRLLRDAGVSGVSDGPMRVDGTGLEAPADWANLRSPETYVGYQRAQNFASTDAARPDKPRTYRAARRLALNEWNLAGDWTIGSEAAVLNKVAGAIQLRFHARDVHLVMGPTRPAGAVPFRVTLDGQPPRAAHGLDVDEDGNGTVREQRLYQLVRQPGPIVDRTFGIEFLETGVEAFAFTFG